MVDERILFALSDIVKTLTAVGVTEIMGMAWCSTCQTVATGSVESVALAQSTPEGVHVLAAPSTAENDRGMETAKGEGGRLVCTYVYYPYMREPALICFTASLILAKLSTSVALATQGYINTQGV